MSYNIKSALVRCDIDVPIKDGIVQDNLRLESVLPTINFLLSKNINVYILGHMGRPSKEGNIDSLSTKQLVKPFEELLKTKVEFIDNIDTFNPGDSKVYILENSRFLDGEEINSLELAQQYSKLADIYINEAFGVSHREHSSMCAITKFLPSYAGLHLAKEISVLEKIANDPSKPFVGIVGGAKVSDKLGITEKLIDNCDQVLIGGAMIFTFLLAQGFNVGNSLCEPDFVDKAKVLLETGKIVLPTDVVVASSNDFSKNIQTVNINAIEEGFSGFDIGAESIRAYSQIIDNAQTILWNGPMGMVEVSPFEKGTVGVAQALANSNAYSVVGGGDSAAAIRNLGFEDKVSHLSTGGGAMLEYVEKGTLVAIEYLKNQFMNLESIV